MLETSTVEQLAAVFAKFPCPVVVLDVESTGGNLAIDHITEVAFIRFDQGKYQYFSQLINPEKPIPLFVQELTGITDEMVASEPTFGAFATELLPLLRGSLLVAHNSHFDYTFLKQAFARVNLDYAAPNLCTVKFSRKLYPEHYKHSLETIIERFGFVLEKRHRAMADVEALCMFLAQSLQEKGETEWLETATQLMHPTPAPAWLPEDLRHAYYALPDSACVLRLIDKDNRRLYFKALAQGFTDTARLFFQQGAQERFAHLASIQCQKALGPLHAYILAHQDESVPLHYTNNQPYYTILLGMDAQGYLQTHITPIKDSLLSAAPIGLFLHNKAAKRALAQWAQTNGICPKALNILMPTPAKTEPCPVNVVGTCVHCIDTQDNPDVHNQKVLENLSKLPCVGFNQFKAFSIQEIDPISQQHKTFMVHAGAVAVKDGKWLFSERLVQILKKKVQTDKYLITLTE